MTQPRRPTGDPHAIRPRATPWRAAGRPNRAELQAAALDGLPLMTATLDASATIVAVNEEWRSFARRNGIGGPTLGVGAVYPSLLSNAMGVATTDTITLLAGIRDLLDGQSTTTFIHDLTIRPPSGPRPIRVMAAPVASRADSALPAGVVIAHLDVPIGGDGASTSPEPPTSVMLDQAGLGEPTLPEAFRLAPAQERTPAEDAFRAAEATYRMLVERLPAIVYIDRLDDVSSNLYISPQVKEILGFEPEDWQADNGLWPRRLHPDDRERAIQDIERAQVSFGPYVSEYRMLAHDGRVVWFRDESVTIRDSTGRPVLMQGVMYDITEQKLAELALVESERRFRELLETIRLAALVLNERGDIAFANDFLLELTGWSREEVVGRSWFDSFVPETDRPLHEATFQALLSHGMSSGVGEMEIITRTGERRKIIWHSTVLRDPQGRVVGAASIGEDATDRRRLEDQLRQAQKMEAVGNLAGGIAHDFNNLLTAIIGYTEVLLGQTKPGDSQEADLREIRRAADRAASLTRQLLAFGRRMPLQPKVIDLGSVVAEIEPMLRRLIGEDIGLVTVAPAHLGRVVADPTQVEQVILNLAVNARDAMPHGGNLRIELGNLEIAGPRADLPNVEPGRYVELSVVDNGTGMDAATLAQVFEPFFTTKGPGRGTGLGLATVYGIVKMSGGSIDVSSEVGRGTSFRIFLPRIDEPATQAHAPIGASGLPLGPLTILVVEDEPAVRSLLRKVLAGNGFPVLEAEDGNAAIEAAAAHEGRIDLLISDVVMPGKRGGAVATELRASRPGLPVLFVSGYPEDAIVQDRILEPGVTFVQKPFAADDLLRAVSELVSGDATTAITD